MGTASPADAQVAGFVGAAVALAIVSAGGIVLVYVMRGYEAKQAPTGVDVAIAAAAPSHTIPHPQAA